MSIAITFSPAARADIPAILEIEKRSQPEPWTEQSFLEEFDRLHSHLLVARLACKAAGEGDPPPPPGGVVGYICYWCVADEIQILNIAVHPDFRRRAVGRTLLSHAIRTGCDKKAGVAVLEVRGSNIAARRLYESAGFKAVGERPGYYGDKEEPAILMELTISR
ncbi:MAG: ribosomal protein S18-alanine N-acetyltransferase [Syntrophobacteraceae bacterium]